MMNEQSNSGETPVKQALREIRRLRDELAAERARRMEPLAIVGMGVRLPGDVDSVESYWDLLLNGVDAVGPIPRDRWPHDQLFDEDSDAAGRYYVKHGGFLKSIDGFDPEFFGIAPVEALTMDPQQRLLLETAWEALEHAGIAPTSLQGSRTGVFVGIGGTDYHRLVMSDPAADTYASTGTLPCVAAGRLSYVLGLNGPALAVDTACSSSLVAVHLAGRSLRAGESDVAIAAGVSLMLSPELTINFCRAGMLSREGRCATFDADADGYVRSEGCGVIIMKRLSDAERNGDRIHALIRGSAINQDGRSSGLTAPSGPAQEAVIRAALGDAQVGADEIAYLEAHGTGTTLGDPIEVHAIGAVFADRPAGDPVLLGSAKTNLGHLEATAGIAGLIKVALMLEHAVVPPHLHFRTPNPYITWDELPVTVAAARSDLPARSLAGVSSFGFSGTNAHVILESPPRTPAPAAMPAGEDLLVLSAPDHEGLAAVAQKYTAFLRTTSEPFAAVCATSRTGRAHFAERLAIIAADAHSAAGMLDAWLAGKTMPQIVSGSVARTREAAVTSSAPSDAAVRAQWLADLAARYVGGELPHWAAMATRVRRASLPTYPFRRRRFWYESSPAVQPADAGGAWTATVTAAADRAELAPVEVGMSSYAIAWTALNDLTLLLGRNALAQLGAFAAAGEEHDTRGVLSVTGVKPVYARIVERWLNALADSGDLVRTHSGFASPTPLRSMNADGAWDVVTATLAADPALLGYVRHCGGMLPDVLTGNVSALETLFPGGSFDLAADLYHNSTLLRYVNGIGAAALDAYVRSLPRGTAIRVLEVGAGTGGTTARLTRVLPADRTDYLFTDVSDIFLDDAATRFVDVPFLRTALFDLEKDPASQGLAEGSWDVVVAANAVHAARDIRKAIERLRGLLVPGGLLLLVESTGHHPWHDITTGLIEGWQHFADDLRTDTPLLTPDVWVDLLRESGFDDVAILPGAESPAAVLKQHLVAARASGVHRAAAAEVRFADGKPTDAAAAPHATSSAVHAAASPRAGEAVGAAPAHDLSPLVAAILGAPDSEREDIAAAEVRDGVIAVLRLDPSRPPARDARLMDLGLDSLMAVRLRNTLQKRLGLAESLPSTLVFDYPTIRQISRFIVSRVANDRPDAAAPAAPAEAVPDITDLSDAEVEAMLLDRLEAEGLT